MVEDVVRDAPVDVALVAGRGVIWSNMGAQEGGPEEQPTQLQATWWEVLKTKEDNQTMYLVTRAE